jgi:hypothetical protein
MYTTPYASLRVPSLDDTNMQQALIDLATDIQFRSSRNQARLDEIRRRRGVCVRASSGLAMGSGSVVTIQFTTEVWDTDGYFNPSSNTVVTLPRGLWMVTAGVVMDGSGSLTWSLMDVAGASYGNIAAKQNGPFASSVASSSWLSASGIFYTTGENVSMHALQASGGAGSLGSAVMVIYKIGNL